MIRARAVPTIPYPNTFQPKGHSGYPGVCPGCQKKGVWGWNARDRKPMLMEEYGNGYASMHHCPTPQTDDIFPGWCEFCKSPELIWMRTSDGIELNETYGLPHTCPLRVEMQLQDISKARCRFCKKDDLLWVKRQAKWSIVDYNGVRHDCGGYGLMTLAWKEAKRMDYAFEKAWINSHPDDSSCKRCKGNGFVRFLSKNKRVLAKYNSTEPIPMQRSCLHCKRLGVFTKEKKAKYLFELRKKYWPFRGGVHKWKKYDQETGQ